MWGDKCAAEGCPFTVGKDRRFNAAHCCERCQRREAMRRYRARLTARPPDQAARAGQSRPTPKKRGRNAGNAGDTGKKKLTASSGRSGKNSSAYTPRRTSTAATSRTRAKRTGR